MNTDLIFALEQKIDELIALCDQLQQENTRLKASQSELQQEHEQLCEKNAQARNRVDNMSSRLRSLEQDT